MGMKESEMELVAGWIDRVCKNITNIDAEAPKIRQEIAELCTKFRIPGINE